MVLLQKLADHRFERLAVARVNAIAEQQIDGARHLGQKCVGIRLSSPQRARKWI